MAANGTSLLVFIDDATANRSSRMNSDMCRAVLFVPIQPNAAKLMERGFTVLERDS